MESEFPKGRKRAITTKAPRGNERASRRENTGIVQRAVVLKTTV